MFTLAVGGQTVQCVCVATHTFVKVHVVGEDFDVGVKDLVLADHLLQDVSDPGREDEQRDAVLMEVVEEELVSFSVKTWTHCY